MRQTVDLILEPLLRRPAKALVRRKARERGAQQRLVLCRRNAVHRVAGEHIAVIAVDRDKVQLLMRVTVCGIIAAPYIIVIVQRRAQVGLKAPRADGGVVRLDVLHVAVRSCDLKVCASIRVHAGERLPLHPLRCEYPVGRHIDGPAVALVAVERSRLPDRAAGPVRIGQRDPAQIARIGGLVKRKVVGAPIVERLAVVRPAGIVYVVLYHPPRSGVQNAIAVRVRKHNEHIVLPVVVPAIAYAVPISLICQ